MNDRRILELFFERSQEAVAEVRKKYGGRLIRLSQNILGNPYDAEECVNDALLTAWNSIPPARPDPLLPWLYAVVRNISMNRYRVNRAGKRGGGDFTVALEELEEAIPGGSTEEAVDSRELTRAVNRFLGKLSKKDLTIFMGRYHYGESFSTIARRLDISEESCKMRASRLRKKLRETLEKEGVL